MILAEKKGGKEIFIRFAEKRKATNFPKTRIAFSKIFETGQKLRK